MSKCMYTATGQLVCTEGSSSLQSNRNLEHFVQQKTESRTISPEWAPFTCTQRCKAAGGKWTGQWTNNLGWNQSTCGCYVFQEYPNKMIKPATGAQRAIENISEAWQCKNRCLNNYPNCTAVAFNNQNKCSLFGKPDGSVFTEQDLANYNRDNTVTYLLM